MSAAKAKEREVKREGSEESRAAAAVRVLPVLACVFVCWLARLHVCVCTCACACAKGTSEKLSKLHGEEAERQLQLQQSQQQSRE